MADKEYFLSSEEARIILGIEENTGIEISLDLNLSNVEAVISGEGLLLPGGILVERSILEEIARKKKRIYALKDDGAEPVEISGEGYYKLSPTTGAPTLEINGIQMHRTSGIDPFEDSRQKTEGTVRPGDTVLDTCGGLGYTAIWSARLGAARVISVEVCPEVRELRKINPWSRELFQDKIELVDANIYEHITKLENESFDSTIHDPPRFSLAGELYGSEFYKHLFRVLKPGGLLFHYTGTPYSRRGERNFPVEVTNRLISAGFRARREPEKLGVSGRK